MGSLMRRMLLLALALTLALTGVATASVRDKIIADCTDDGVLQGTYTAKQLRDARKHLPSDVAEYSDCADVLRRAELPSNAGSGGGGTTTPGVSSAPGAPTGNGGATTKPLVPETPQDNDALAQSSAAPETPVKVGGQDLLAGAAPLREGYRANGLPNSLKIALVLLALAGLALSFPPVRRRLLSLRRRP